eukprot:3415094-Pyramimonas_sp.AAC.1
MPQKRLQTAQGTPQSPRGPATMLDWHGGGTGRRQRGGNMVAVFVELQGRRKSALTAKLHPLDRYRLT